MIVAGFFTNDQYKALAFDMRKSAEALGLECVLYEMPNAGSWTANVNIKPKIVKYALQAFPKDDVLYLDADAKFLKYPELLRNPAEDFAAYWDTPKRPCGGTLWFRNNPLVHALVDQWQINVNDRPTHADDWQNLNAALGDYRQIRKLHLPPGYNWHKATMRARFPRAEPVIEHGAVGSHTYSVY